MSHVFNKTLLDTDRRVLSVLQDAYPDWISPTAIGLALGYAYPSASSSVMRPLKRLVALGLAELDLASGFYRAVRQGGAYDERSQRRRTHAPGV